jgi:5-methylcytosine-specific restriction protein B
LSLVNISDLIEQCRSNYSALTYKSDIQLDQSLSELLIDALRSIDGSATHIVSPFSIEFVTNDGLRATVPSSSLWYAHSYWRLSGQLNAYKETLKTVKSDLRANAGHSTADIKTFFNTLPDANLTVLTSTIATDFLDSINNTLTNVQERDFFIRLCSYRGWWIKPIRTAEVSSGKTLDRADIFNSALALACGVVVDSSSKMLLVIKAFEVSSTLRNYFSSINFDEFDFNSTASPAIESDTKLGENIIFYGAPGTGKSYKVDKHCSEANSVRTVFHPDTQYSDFVGCLKPSMTGKEVVYAFRPGPFILALQLACEKNDEHVYLVVEEINRAASAAAFGELFQLLDREPSGLSKYSITVSDPDMLEYLQSKAADTLTGNKLKIPANLSIYATMNSSDQAVMPMDTAFKRRWKFDYIPISFKDNDGNPAGPAGSFRIPFSDDKISNVEWRVLAKTINSALIDKNIPEDRLLGPWFLSESELMDENASKSSLRGKLLLYLWDDVLRHGDKEVLFSRHVKTFGRLIENLQNNKEIFSKEIEGMLRTESKIATSSDSEGEGEGEDSSDVEIKSSDVATDDEEQGS